MGDVVDKGKGVLFLRTVQGVLIFGRLLPADVILHFAVIEGLNEPRTTSLLSFGSGYARWYSTLIREWSFCTDSVGNCIT